MRLDLGIIAGDNTKQFLSDLTTIVERFEKVTRALRSPEQIADAEESEDEAPRTKKAGKAAGSKKKASFDDNEEETEEETASDDAPETEESEEDDEFAKASAKKGKKSKVASFDDESEEEEASETEEEAPRMKKAAKGAKKLTKDDVNDACMAHAKVHGYKTTKGILEKKFKVSSVTELDEDDYAAVIAAVAVASKGKK